MFEPFRRPFNPSVPSLFETCFANIFRIPFVLPPNTHIHIHTNTHTVAHSHHTIMYVLYVLYVFYESISIIFFHACAFFPIIKFQSRAKKIIIIVINGFLQCKRNIPSLWKIGSQIKKKKQKKTNKFWNKINTKLNIYYIMHTS